VTATTTRPAADATRSARPGLSKLAWVTWRQHRTALLGMLAVTAVGALVLLGYGLSMHSAFKSSGMADCLPGHQTSNCNAAQETFHNTQNRVTQLIALFLPLPVLYGLFIGAPLLAREYESGTYRFAFTQGAGRTRWLVMKIALLSAFTIVTASALTFVVMWWYGPLVPLNGRLGNSAVYESYGAVFVARSLFALAVGIAAGAVLRRIVPAIGATLGVWLVVVIPSIVALRQHFMSPLKALNEVVPPNAWTISSQWAAPDGHKLSGNELADLQYKTASAGHKLNLDQYLTSQGYKHLVNYQPASRFWSFQAIEAGGLTVLSIILLAVAVQLVRRRAA
jgi:ABC-type transport system involved in multi-copper enzyme maturation permease subunit